MSALERTQSTRVPFDEPLHAPWVCPFTPGKITGATKALFGNDHIVIDAWPHAAVCPGPEECRFTNLVIRDHPKEPWSGGAQPHCARRPETPGRRCMGLGAN